jgi:hypothetical protein
VQILAQCFICVFWLGWVGSRHRLAGNWMEKEGEKEERTRHPRMGNIFYLVGICSRQVCLERKGKEKENYNRKTTV